MRPSNFLKNNRWIYPVMFVLTVLVLIWALPLWKFVWVIVVVVVVLIFDFLEHKEKPLDKGKK